MSINIVSMGKLLSLVSILLSCTGKEAITSSEVEKTKIYYTCSMHPQIKLKKPGKCPICHMNLTKVIEELEDTVSEPLVKKELNFTNIIAKVKLRKAQIEHFHPEYIPVTSMKMSKKIRLLGSVIPSEERGSKISARVAGRIEKVFVTSRGSLIERNDPIVELYSPELISAGEEFLIAQKSFLASKTQVFKEILDKSIQKLQLWGMKPFQYKRWFKERKVPTKIILHSSSRGIVQKRNAIVGKYFKKGENFFELSDLSKVWVEMDVYEQDVDLIREGQKIKMEFTSLPGTLIESRIDFINPFLDPRSRTLKIRATMDNLSGKLRPGMAGEAILHVQFEGMSLVIPRSAIIDTGRRKVVWRKISQKSFSAIVIQTGRESEGYVEVLDGLKLHDEVIVEGNFLLDAQAQLFGGYED